MAEYMCDFETTTDPADCRVWAACACDVETNAIVHLSNSINTFMEWCGGFKKTAKLYFHNLKFDGEFILSWLFRNGFTYSESPKKMEPRTFNTLVSDMGQFYKMTIQFTKKKKIEIFDSLKKLPFKVAKIAKDFGLEMTKGEIDYTLKRPEGWEITPEEQDYIERDCRIVASALFQQEEEGMVKMTTAADAMYYYKNLMGRQFEYWFPTLPKELDDDIRRGYKGGFTYLNPKYKGKRIASGVVFDVNSLYPSCMYFCPLPWGYPVFFEGKYEPDDYYPLYISRIRCSFQIKPDHIPCVQIKRGVFQETEYLESSDVEIDGHIERMEVELTLTSVDLDLFLDHYDVEGLEYISGFKFKAQVGMFKDYIDHWMHIKETSPANSAQRAISKLYLNSLYGKFASATERMKKTPYMCPDGVVRYYTYHEPERDRDGNLIFESPSKLRFKRDSEGFLIEREPEIVDPVYTPVGAFITAWARNKTIRSAQKVYDRFIYADTDSLHLEGDEIPADLEVHPTALGKWKHEGTWTDAKFLRAKTYMETIHKKEKKDTLQNYVKLMQNDNTDWIERRTDGIHYGKRGVTCAGMPDNVKASVTYDTFEPGAVFPGKLLPKRVPGGVVLMPVDFTIKL